MKRFAWQHGTALRVSLASRTGWLAPPGPLATASLRVPAGATVHVRLRPPACERPVITVSAPAAARELAGRGTPDR